MAPNEIGDLLAGSFGPLAVLWLILGYFQQGEELKQSTRALELQAEELRNSVAQQKELVAATREAVQAERDAAMQQTQPKFVLSLSSRSNGPDGPFHSIQANNFGAPATNLKFDFGNLLRLTSDFSYPYLNRGDFVNLRVAFSPNHPANGDRFHVTYMDINNSVRTAVFKISVIGDSIEFFQTNVVAN